MADDFFGRKYELTLGGLEVPPITELRVTFEVHRSLKAEPNKSRISIYNLSEQTRGKLAIGRDKDVQVSLQAGYESNMGLIFLGDLRRVDQIEQEIDWVTTLRAGDGEKKINETRVNRAFSKGVKLKEVVDFLVKEGKHAAGNIIKQLKDSKVKEFNIGYVASGNAYDKLTQLLHNLGYDLSVQNGELLALKPDEAMPGPIFGIASGRGMEGSPEFGEKDTVKVTSRLNSRLVPGGKVELDSKVTGKGFYRIESLVHVGDTHGKEWSTKLTLRKMTAA